MLYHRRYQTDQRLDYCFESSLTTGNITDLEKSLIKASRCAAWGGGGSFCEADVSKSLTSRITIIHVLSPIRITRLRYLLIFFLFYIYIYMCVVSLAWFEIKLLWNLTLE